jgi:hypothetical protein
MQSLPDDILRVIGDKLNGIELLRLRTTCKELHSICDNDKSTCAQANFTKLVHTIYKTQLSHNKRCMAGFFWVKLPDQGKTFFLREGENGEFIGQLSFANFKSVRMRMCVQHAPDAKHLSVEFQPEMAHYPAEFATDVWQVNRKEMKCVIAYLVAAWYVRMHHQRYKSKLRKYHYVPASLPPLHVLAEKAWLPTARLLNQLNA